jgi:hypothetical protein
MFSLALRPTAVTLILSKDNLLVFVLAPLAIAEATMRERIADVERGVTILDRIDPDDD